MSIDFGPVSAVAHPSASVALSTNAFLGYRPVVQSMRTSRYEVGDWRIIEGLPKTEARVLCGIECVVSVANATSVLGYPAPDTVNTRADYRWLPEDFDIATGNWPADPDTSVSSPHHWDSWDSVANGYTWSDLLGLEMTWSVLKLGRVIDQTERTWTEAAATFTWNTMRFQTFNKVLYPNYSADDAQWFSMNATDPTLLDNYAYWRAGAYADNPAVGFLAEQMLVLSFTDPEIPAMTMLVTAVLRPPSNGQYTVLSASDGIHLVFGADGQLQLLYEGAVLATQSLGGRARPNEPVVVGISVSPIDSAIYLVVVDTGIKVLRGDVGTLPTVEELVWVMGFTEDATMEVLEVDLYSTRMTPAGLASAASALDRIYGVTAS